MMPLTPRSNRRIRRGFTLVELIVAGMAGMLVVAAVTVFGRMVQQLVRQRFGLETV